MRSALVLVASSDTVRRGEIVGAAERAGHRVLEAVDGVHTVTAATRYIPDLVIADAVLPQLDGPQVAARLAENPDTTDVAILLVDGAAPVAPDTTHVKDVVVIESIADVTREMARLLSRRTAVTDGIVMLRRALADVRASAGDRGGDADAGTHARARHIANSVEESMISVLVADDDARYLEANAAACALSGYSRDELLALTIWDLTPEQRVPHDRRLWDRFLRDGRFEGSYRIRRRTGETVTIRCAASANVSPGLHVSALAPARLLEVIRS